MCLKLFLLSADTSLNTLGQRYRTCQDLKEEQERRAEAPEVDLTIQIQPVFNAGKDLDSNACKPKKGLT